MKENLLSYTNSSENIERKWQIIRHDYGVRSKSRTKVDQVSSGGLAPSQNQRMQEGHKSFLSMEQKQAPKDSKEGKQLTIGRDLRAEKPLDNGS